MNGTNRELAAGIEKYLPGARVNLPQDFKYDDRYNDSKAFGLIFKGCIDGVDACDVLVAWLDGPDSDSGTCFEVGYAYAKGIPCVGVRTDNAKLIKYPGHPEWTEAFDLTKDPYEIKNLASDPTFTTPLEAELDAHLKSLAYTATPKARKNPPVEGVGAKREASIKR